MSFIYVIASTDAGPTKIGLSKSPEKRLKQLQTGHPLPLKLYYVEEFCDKKVALVERSIHTEIRHHKSSGEWFNLTVEQAIMEVKYALVMHGD